MYQVGKMKRMMAGEQDPSAVPLEENIYGSDVAQQQPVGQMPMPGPEQQPMQQQPAPYFSDYAGENPPMDDMLGERKGRFKFPQR